MIILYPFKRDDLSLFYIKENKIISIDKNPAKCGVFLIQKSYTHQGLEIFYLNFLTDIYQNGHADHHKS